MKVLFVNNSTSNPNWGDRAAAIALRMMITSQGGRIDYALTELQLSATQLDLADSDAAPGSGRSRLKDPLRPAFRSCGAG
jgi:hypothetical protein